MWNARLTAGARRILNRAGQLAGETTPSLMEPVHLLWALVLEESRGAEILERHGLDRPTLAQAFPLDLAVLNREADLDADPPAEDVPFSDDLMRVQREAELQAGRQGRHAELGSEHLLIGLAAAGSTVSDLLRTHGLTAESLQTLVEEQHGLPQAPLMVEFKLSESRPAANDATDLYRILDAAANRAREGVRVLEDYVRFALDDAFLTAQLKSWRHDLRSVLSALDDRRLLSSRDTQTDVGTELSTPGERLRQTPMDVLRANGKRIQEALRTLEEFSKILSPRLGEQCSQLRYRFYTLEKALAVHSESRRRLAGRNLYLLITQSQCPLGAERTIRESLEAGADVIQIREKTLSDRALVEWGRKVREWTRAAGALVIMNDRPDLAVLIEADGVHVGQEELTVHHARRIVGPDRLIGVSTHNLDQARQAVLAGADYLGVGPTFSSLTKSFEELAGLAFVREVAQEITLPWFAIGGITLENLPTVQEAGAARVAVSHAICAADNPRDAVANFKAALQRSEVGGQRPGE